VRDFEWESIEQPEQGSQRGLGLLRHLIHLDSTSSLSGAVFLIDREMLHGPEAFRP
jgi:hypothetical protein